MLRSVQIFGQTRPMVLILLVPEQACYTLSFFMNCDPCGHQLALSLGLQIRGFFLNVGMPRQQSENCKLNCSSSRSSRGFQFRRNHARVSSPRFSLPLPHVPHSEPILLQVSPLRCEKVGASRDRQRGILTFNFDLKC